MLWLRPTSVQKYETCGEQYRLSEVKRLRPRLTGSALVFGSSVHKACLGWLEAQAEGKDTEAPEEMFVQQWERVLEKTNIRFSSSHGQTELRSIGVKLCKQFPEEWTRLGLIPVMSPTGLLIENRLRITLDATTGLSGEPDLVCMDRNGEIVVVDLKTPVTAAFEGFADYAEQLTAYQVLVDAHRERFEIPRVMRHLFFEGLKKKDAQWHAQWGQRHSDAAEQGYLRKLRKVASLIREGYFPQRSASAFDSPCNLCDLRAACRRSEIDGFMVDERDQIVPATLAVLDRAA